MDLLISWLYALLLRKDITKENDVENHLLQISSNY